MRYWKGLLPLTMLSAVGGYANCPGTWTGSTSADWDVASNWSPASCVPGTVSNTDTATFTASSGSGYTISLDAPAVSPTLETLTLNSATAYTIQSTTTNKLEFTAPSTTIDVLAGSHVINADVLLTSTTWTLALVSGQLTLEKPLSSTSSSAVLTGSGTFVNLNNTSGMSLSNSMTVQSGNLNNTATVTPAASSNGTEISVGTNWIINGGTTTNLNQATISNSNSNGALIQVSDSLTVSGGALVNNNTVAVTAATDSKGAYITAASFNLNSGTVTNSNSAAVSATSDFGSSIGISGAVVISGGSLTNTSSVAVTSPGTAAQFNGMSTLTMTGGTIINTGPVGQGDFVSFDGLASISGGTVINDDTCILGSLNVSGSALVRGTGTYNVAGAVSVSGGMLLYNGMFTAGSLNISGGAVKGTGTFNSGGAVTVSGGMLRNDGTLTGTSLTIGSGGIVKGKGSFQFSGPFSVSGGLNLNGGTFQASSFNIGSTGTLSGSGLVQGPGAGNTTVSNDGTVRPGSQGGTMTIDGTYTQTSTGTFVANVGHAAPLLDVTGAASINGTLKVGLSGNGTASPTDTFTILSAGGGVTGTFSTVINNPNMTDLAAQVIYNPDSVVVLLNATIDIATYSFQSQMATLDSINFIQTYTLDLIDDLIDLINPTGSTTVAAGPFSFNEDELTAANEPSQVQQLQYELNQEIEQVEEKGRYFRRRKERKANKQAQKTSTWRFYVGETIAKSSTVAESNSHGTRSWSIGELIGFDAAFSQWGIGVLTEENYTFERSKHHGNFSYANHLSISSYLTYLPRQLPNFALNASVGTGYVWHKKPRKAGHGKGRVTCLGKPKEWECNSMLGGQYTFANNQFSWIPKNFKFSPEFDLRYSHSHEHSFYEHGGGMYNSKYKHSTVNSLKTNLSSRFDYSWTGNQVNTTLDLYVGWQRELILKHTESVFGTIKPFKKYTKLVFLTAQNHFQFSPDFSVALKSLFVADLKYQFDWDKRGHSHNLTGKASFKF